MFEITKSGIIMSIASYIPKICVYRIKTELEALYTLEALGPDLGLGKVGSCPGASTARASTCLNPALRSTRNPV